MINKINKLDELFNKAIKNGVAGAFAAGIGTGKSGKIITSCRGKISQEENSKEVDDKTLFDLASLTKPLATTLVFISLMVEGRLDPDQVINEFFPHAPADKADIPISMLLSHSAGFIAHRKFYADPEPDDDIFHQILHTPLVYAPGSRSVYSDPGFILLGRIVEIAGNKGLSALVDDLYRQLDIQGYSGFIPDLDLSEKKVCACQWSDWRQRVVCGEVSDDNCYFMGGVGGHAGLFGDIRAVSDLVLKLLDIWQGRIQYPVLPRRMINDFFCRRNIPGSTWGFGFDHPDKQNSSAGRLLSRNSAGHLGFTGTSFWLDPEHDLAIVLLSNRIHPDPKNRLIRDFRPLFHDMVIKLFFPERA